MQNSRFFSQNWFKGEKSRVRASRARNARASQALRVCGAGEKKTSVSPQPRSPFSAFVKLFVRTVYLNMQKYRLFCSLLLNLLSHRHSNSFHMRVFPRRILGLQPRDKAAMLVQQIFFRRIYMKIEFSSQRREMLFVLDHQHTTVTSRANQQLLMLVNM